MNYTSGVLHALDQEPYLFLPDLSATKRIKLLLRDLWPSLP